jgi:hypothetical protein
MALNQISKIGHKQYSSKSHSLSHLSDLPGMVTKDKVPNVDQIGAHCAQIAKRHRRHDGIDGGLAHLGACEHNTMDQIGQNAKKAQEDTNSAMDWGVGSENEENIS